MDRWVDATAEVLDALREIFTADDSLREALEGTANDAARVIADADAVTVIRHGEPETVARTDNRYLDTDQRQYDAGRGPCLDAARSLRPVRATTGEHREQWQEFAVARIRSGGRSGRGAGLPVGAAGDRRARPRAELAGSLNLYSHTAAAFDPFDEALLRPFTTSWAPRPDHQGAPQPGHVEDGRRG